jgi:membrane-associated phospholipid phosphatase
MSARVLSVCASVLCATGPSIAGAKSPKDYAVDARDYALAPLEWDAHDWAFAGGAAVAILAAYSVDSNVKHHFAPPDATPQGDPNSLRDAAPMIALTLGTIGIGALRDDRELKSTGYDMVEAAALGIASSFGLKHLTGRLRPDSTDNPREWRAGGDSFPSGHVTAIFAVTQVLANSRPEGKWTWRIVGYSLGAATAYARLDGNVHWLSDTVAGAALGIATGEFVSHRGQLAAHKSAVAFSVQPLRGGAMLGFSVDPYELMR